MFRSIDQHIIVGGKMTDEMDEKEVIHVNDIGYENLLFKLSLAEYFSIQYFF